MSARNGGQNSYPAPTKEQNKMALPAAQYRASRVSMTVSMILFFLDIFWIFQDQPISHELGRAFPSLFRGYLVVIASRTKTFPAFPTAWTIKCPLTCHESVHPYQSIKNISKLYKLDVQRLYMFIHIFNSFLCLCLCTYIYICIFSRFVFFF